MLAAPSRSVWTYSFWKQKTRRLYNHMWKYSCSCLTRAWYFVPVKSPQNQASIFSFTNFLHFSYCMHRIGTTASNSYPLPFGLADEMQYVKHQPLRLATDEGLYSSDRRFAILFYQLETWALPTNPSCFSTSKFHSTSVVSLLMKLHGSGCFFEKCAHVWVTTLGTSVMYKITNQKG